MTMDLNEVTIMRQPDNIQRTQMVVEATMEVSQGIIFRHPVKTTPTPITKLQMDTS
jgi:hypothetical protein